MMIKDKLYLGKSCQNQAILTLLENMTSDYCPNNELVQSYQQEATTFLIQPFFTSNFNQNQTIHSFQKKSLTVVINLLYESIENYLQKVNNFFNSHNFSLKINMYLKEIITNVEENVLFKEEQVFLHALYLRKILGQKNIDKEKFSLRLSCFSFDQYVKEYNDKILKQWGIVNKELVQQKNTKKILKQIIVFLEEWKYIQWIEQNLFLQKALLLEKEIIKNIYPNK